MVWDALRAMARRHDPLGLDRLDVGAEYSTTPSLPRPPRPVLLNGDDGVEGADGAPGRPARRGCLCNTQGIELIERSLHPDG